MGLGGDWLSDHCFEQDFPFGLPSDTWKAGDGRKIPLKEMTESHILNCMRVVGEDDGWYHRFQEELFSRATNRGVGEQVENIVKTPHRMIVFKNGSIIEYVPPSDDPIRSSRYGQ